MSLHKWFYWGEVGHEIFDEVTRTAIGRAASEESAAKIIATHNAEIGAMWIAALEQVLKPNRQYSGQDVDCYAETATRCAGLIRALAALANRSTLAPGPIPCPPVNDGASPIAHCSNPAEGE
jgi:hypothetical protein